jgi:hypothetical protein
MIPINLEKNSHHRRQKRSDAFGVGGGEEMSSATRILYDYSQNHHAIIKKPIVDSIPMDVLENDIVDYIDLSIDLVFVILLI